MLLSNDYEFVERARSSYVPAQRVEFPDGLPRRAEASWDRVCDALYVLAVTFGVLRLPRATVFGTWTGKTGEEWRDEKVLVDARSPVLAEHLERSSEIVDAYGG